MNGGAFVKGHDYDAMNNFFPKQNEDDATVSGVGK